LSFAGTAALRNLFFKHLALHLLAQLAIDNLALALWVLVFERKALIHRWDFRVEIEGSTLERSRR
jgi:hypothetical protein